MEEHFGFTSDNINEDVKGRSSGSRLFKRKSIKDPKEKIAMRKAVRKKKQEKKTRIIIRNLSFKMTEKDLMKVFSTYGNVVDVHIPMKPDGKMRGFAFIQYENFQSTVKAVKNLNYKMLDGRPIAIDYAIAKDKYQHITSAKHTSGSHSDKTSQENDATQAKEETSDQAEVTSSDEASESGFEDEDAIELVPEDDENDHVKKFMKEFDADRESTEDEKEEPLEEEATSDSLSESDESEKDNDSDESGGGDDDDVENDDAKTCTSKRKRTHDSVQVPPNKRKKLSGDVSEGKTVFIRNISFDANEDSLRKSMESFGPVKYCLLCIDQFTELPKGTAFVKFENKEDADKVIEKASDMNSEGIFLDGRRLSCTVALSQEELESKRNSGVKTKSDKRNLYLLKEGLIRKGSEEAEGVSQSDLAVRAKLEVLKRNKLKNLQFFVSDKRLCVHNIPSYYTDAEFRKLFRHAAGHGAKITEARIMRDLKKRNGQGIAQSRGFGFVAFERHEDALNALRKINNNPDIFTQQKRPVVEFAVENKNALLAKQRRAEKSRMKNKRLEKSEADHPVEDMESWKFNKKTNSKKGGKDEDGKKVHFVNSSGKGNPVKGKLKKKKIGSKVNLQRKFNSKGGEAYINSNSKSPVKEKKKRKQKNKQQKSKGLSQNIDREHFSQMVNKYKQTLLSKM